MAAILTSHGQILTNALRIRLVSIYGNGAGGVRVQHMSPYNTRAPSPRFAGLMRSYSRGEESGRSLVSFPDSTRHCDILGWERDYGNFGHLRPLQLSMLFTLIED